MFTEIRWNFPSFGQQSAMFLSCSSLAASGEELSVLILETLVAGEEKNDLFITVRVQCVYSVFSVPCTFNVALRSLKRRKKKNPQNQ